MKEESKYGYIEGKTKKGIRKESIELVWLMRSEHKSKGKKLYWIYNLNRVIKMHG